MPILGPEHDLAHPVEGDEAWSESYYFNGYDPTCDVGLFTRIGVRPNEGTIDGGFTLWLPGTRVAGIRGVREQHEMTDSDLAVAGIRYERLEPLRRGRITASGTADVGDLATFVAKMVELDPGSDWSVDPGTGLFKTEPTATQRTRKVQRPIVLYDATEHHPAQTQLITEDVIAGQWTTVKYSGAIPAPRKKQLLGRIEKLSNAVKFAREQANAAEAPEQKLAREVFDHLFAP